MTTVSGEDRERIVTVDSRSIFDSRDFNERLFFPRDDDAPTPAGARDLALQMEDGVALHARFHPAPDARVTFVVFHGNGEIVADYDPQAALYRDVVGASLAVLDFRGYGRAGARRRTGRDRRRRAVGPCARVALADVIERTPLIVLGRSLGGACAAEVAGTSPCPADAIVMESAGAFPRTLIERRGLTPPTSFTEEEARLFDPRPKLARAAVPVLVLHGARDTIIPADEAHATFAALTTPRRTLVLVPGRDHNDVAHDAAYWNALRDFAASIAPTPT
ncbi:MAG: alpha/beta hydrolase [Polyangiaceae bacterium]